MLNTFGSSGSSTDVIRATGSAAVLPWPTAGGGVSAASGADAADGGACAGTARPGRAAEGAVGAVGTVAGAGAGAGVDAGPGGGAAGGTGHSDAAVIGMTISSDNDVSKELRPVAGGR